MDNFKIIYKILRHLEASMDCEETDTGAISAERLGITRMRWEQILIMLQDNEYITGIICAQGLTSGRRHIIEPIRPAITLKGLEYLADNSFMKRAVEAMKTVKDVVPGV